MGLLERDPHEYFKQNYCVDGIELRETRDGQMNYTIYQGNLEIGSVSFRPLGDGSNYLRKLVIKHDENNLDQLFASCSFRGGLALTFTCEGDPPLESFVDSLNIDGYKYEDQLWKLIKKIISGDQEGTHPGRLPKR